MTAVGQAQRAGLAAARGAQAEGRVASGVVAAGLEHDFRAPLRTRQAQSAGQGRGPADQGVVAAVAAVAAREGVQDAAQDDAKGTP